MVDASTLKRFSTAWLLMWAISYFAVAIVAPNISGNPLEGAILFAVFGVALLVAVALTRWGSGTLHLVGQVMLVVLAVLSVYSGVVSWTGVELWVTPFANVEILQVSMAFLDLLGATFMLALAIDDY